MSRKLVILILAVAAIGLLVFALTRSPKSPVQTNDNRAAARPTAAPVVAAQVPAHYDVAPNAADLRPTLRPDQYSGKTRTAYEAAKQIPALLAQMPCYCHCDRGMGHKSLHSCFEDDHAAHCATCVDEALMAYELKKQGLSAKQIRDKIIAEFAD